MKARILWRSAAVTVATVSACFGFTGFAAAQAVISNTGPDSTNTITTTVDNTCTITNDNDLNLTNNNDQTAITGSATSSNNTNAGGLSSNWGAFDPAVWQAQGRSFAEWQAAVAAYTTSLQSQWGSISGGGGATSGNASNNSNFHPSVSITNGGAKKSCGCGCKSVGVVGGPTTITNTGPDSTNTVNNSSTSDTIVGNNNKVGLTNNNSQFAGTGNATSSNNTNGGFGGSGGALNGSNFGGNTRLLNNATTSGGSGAGGPGTSTSGSILGSTVPGTSGCGCGAGFSPNTTISNTGPDSTNTVNNTYTNKVSTTNTNNVTFTNNNQQTANSGDATVTNNTNAGAASSGTAANGSSTTPSATISN